MILILVFLAMVFIYYFMQKEQIRREQRRERMQEKREELLEQLRSMESKSNNQT